MIQVLLLIVWVSSGILPVWWYLEKNESMEYTSRMLGIMSLMGLMGPIAGILVLISWCLTYGDTEERE